MITLKYKMDRVWAMPSKNTFSIPPIKSFISRYTDGKTEIIDPFSNTSEIAKYRNDIAISGIDSSKWLTQFKSNSMDVGLFDPPYSPRQLKECYNGMGMTLHDTKSSVWKIWKDELSRIVDGYILSFGWSTNGMGLNRGFEIEEILLIAHGGNHNDTICVAERKVS
jgi:hypothetical protein